MIKACGSEFASDTHFPSRKGYLVASKTTKPGQIKWERSECGIKIGQELTIHVIRAHLQDTHRGRVDVISELNETRAKNVLQYFTEAAGSANHKDIWEQSEPADFEFEALGKLYNALPEELQEDLRSSLERLPRDASLVDAINRPGVFDVLDQALNLSDDSRSLVGTISQMGKEEMESALNALADLLRHGVVGYEYREINGSPQKVFIDVAIGSDAHRAPLARGAKFDRLI